MIKLSALILLFYLNSASSQCLTNSSRISEERCLEYSRVSANRIILGKSLTSEGLVKWDYNCEPRYCNSGQIVGGTEALAGEFPHMAALGWKSNNQIKFRCGGSLISEKFVLTAAHCTFESQPPSLVRLGANNFEEKSPGAIEINVKSFIKHPQYRSSEDLNDIALIELENEVNLTHFKDSIRPACLAQSDPLKPKVLATGWGRTTKLTSQNFSKVLLKVSIEIRDLQNCSTLRVTLKDNQICAGGQKGFDTCEGDSGGPIQTVSSLACCIFNIVGITSFGNPYCGLENNPSVYTKVWSYLDWIEGIVWPCTS